MGEPSTFENPDPHAELPSVLALRRAISPVYDLFDGETDPEDPPSIAALRASLHSTDGIRREGRLGEIGALLTQLIHDARAAVHTSSGADAAAAHSVLAVAYQVEATTLAALGKEDAAFTAIERSMQSVRQSDDPHLETLALSTLSWVFTKQGRLADAETVALKGAAAIEPNFRSAPKELALWGVLILRAATAVVRQDRRDDVTDLLNIASAAAARIGTDQLVYATPFGPTNAGVAKVNFLVEMERAPRGYPGRPYRSRYRSPPPTWRARFYVDLALAHAELHQDASSARALLRAEQAAPEWMRYHATTRRLTGELRERSTRRDAPVVGLAARLGVAG